MAKKDAQIKVRVKNKGVTNEVFNVVLNGKQETLLPNEKLTIDPKDLNYLNSLDNDWKFYPIEEQEGDK
ncbi:MAG: hypothetical protein L0L10_04880 [Tetragenococcus sp.]|nr:hypothetical protein [Tetragenococcus sp.]